LSFMHPHHSWGPAVAFCRRCCAKGGVAAVERRLLSSGFSRGLCGTVAAAGCRNRPAPEKSAAPRDFLRSGGIAAFVSGRDWVGGAGAAAGRTGRSDRQRSGLRQNPPRRGESLVRANLAGACCLIPPATTRLAAQGGGFCDNDGVFYETWAVSSAPLDNEWCLSKKFRKRLGRCDVDDRHEAGQAYRCE